MGMKDLPPHRSWGRKESHFPDMSHLINGKYIHMCMQSRGERSLLKEIYFRTISAQRSEWMGGYVMHTQLPPLVEKKGKNQF